MAHPHPKRPKAPPPPPLDVQIYNGLLGVLGLHLIGTDGKDYEVQMAYFLGIVIWSFSIKVELLVGHCWSPCCRFFNEKRF